MPTTSPRTPRRAPTTGRRPQTTTPRSRPTIPGRRKPQPQPQSKGQQVLKALASAVPAGKAASKAKSAGGKAPAKGIALLGLAGGVAAALKSRNAKKAKADAIPVEPVAAPAVTSVPEPSPVEARPDGTL